MLALVLDKIKPTIPVQTKFLLDQFFLSSFLLKTLQVKYPDNYVNLQLDDNIDYIICYKKDPTQLNWKIVLPESMVLDTVKWFHQVMGHPGEKRL